MSFRTPLDRAHTTYTRLQCPTRGCDISMEGVPVSSYMTGIAMLHDEGALTEA
ncbi:MAG: hypothetical protein ABF623_04185 [Gluconobacter cerinus]|uniref:hypothetical protein n=1 Tax=Gluconobacter cerinus TaxID=38307 RepID=UPI0039EB95B1